MSKISKCAASAHSLRGAFYRSDPFEKVPVMLGERGLVNFR